MCHKSCLLCITMVVICWENHDLLRFAITNFVLTCAIFYYTSNLLTMRLAVKTTLGDVRLYELTAMGHCSVQR